MSSQLDLMSAALEEVFDPKLAEIHKAHLVVKTMSSDALQGMASVALYELRRREGRVTSKQLSAKQSAKQVVEVDHAGNVR